MIQDFEQSLFADAGESVDVPDSDDFLKRLHRTLDRRNTLRRTVAVSVSTAAVILVTTLGLFLNLTDSNGQDYLVNDQFVLFSDIGETGTVEVDWVDPSLLLEALNYLIQEADLMENGWKTVETLDELGYIDFQPPSNLEG